MKNSGQSLIEVLVAFSAIIIVLSAITTIVISSLNQASSARNSSLAIQYAQEGLEQMKLVTLPGNGTYCLGKDATLPRSGACQTADSIDGQFRREVDISTGVCGVTLKQVTVKVSWTDSTCRGRQFCKSTPLTTCL